MGKRINPVYILRMINTKQYGKKQCDINTKTYCSNSRVHTYHHYVHYMYIEVILMHGNRKTVK